MRLRSLRFLVTMLDTRLSSFGYASGPRPELLAEMIHGPGPDDDQIASCRLLVGSPTELASS